MIRLGDASIQCVQEKLSGEPVGLFGIDADLMEAESARLRGFYRPGSGMLELSVHSWIVQVDGLVVLIDPCIGNHKNRPGRPFAHQLDLPYLDRFAATGLAPAEVDVVICTHLHCDHCGWNTRLIDGRWVPTFPNARYLFGRTERARWELAALGENDAAVIEDSVAPIVAAGLAEIVEDHHRVSPSLTIAPAAGHTLGHAMVRLASGGAEGLFAGDALHHPIEILHPETGVRGFEDAATGIATRRAILALCAERGALLMPGHFVQPHAVWIDGRAGAYDFREFAG